MPGNGSELLDGGKAGLGPEPHVGALVAGVLLTAAVLAGNTLVCVSVAAERALQTPTNFFIVSLAVADLLLALLVLPLFVYSEFQGGTWALSTRLCDALMALDVMLCTASIFNLCAISVDRFIAVSVPLNYSRQQGGKRQLALIGATWGLAFAVASPVLFGLNDVPGRDPTVCQLESRSYVVASSVCSFFLPCPLMLVLYCAMYLRLRAWEEARRAKLSRSMRPGAARRPAGPLARGGRRRPRQLAPLPDPDRGLPGAAPPPGPGRGRWNNAVPPGPPARVQRVPCSPGAPPALGVLPREPAPNGGGSPHSSAVAPKPSRNPKREGRNQGTESERRAPGPRG
uniref:G-protein coupled receptors family 1 profile domain-containing protein n=1 Tax=Monodelphis domestica TaxID=13616 RepID=H9H5Y7_MONDO